MPAGDGCDKSLAWWFTDEPWAKPKKKPGEKPVKPRLTTMADLPKACALVLNGPAPASEEAATFGTAYRAAAPAPATEGIEQVIGAAAGDVPPTDIPVPLARPALQ
ncbi:hypothetical protein D9M72_643750 [compost metagenome]